MQKYIPIMGLEIHVQLKSNRKMFCFCDANYYDDEPNTHTCPICLGMPGTLPVPNIDSIKNACFFAKALNCKINQQVKFQRKNYFYPDLPKGYQLTQFVDPIGENGKLETFHQDKKISLKIERLQLEEDAGKSTHLPNQTIVDFNKAGISLVEIVTEPEIYDIKHLPNFVKELRDLARHINVSDCDLEKGHMRFDLNISLLKKEEFKKNNFSLPKYKVEIKNLNSITLLEKVAKYEISRQSKILNQNQIPVQETRGTRDLSGKTYSQRIKVDALDYRIFPEPDIPPYMISDEFLSDSEKKLKTLKTPFSKMQDFLKKYKIKHSDAYILTREKNMSDFFENIANKMPDEKPQDIANLIVNKKIDESLMNFKKEKEFIKKAKKILTPVQTDTEKLKIIISEIFQNPKNQKAIQEYKSGKESVLKFFIGQVMKEMRGKADPKLVIKYLKSQIKIIEY